MLFAVLSGFLIAPLIPWLQRRLKTRSGWVLSLLPWGVFAFFALQAPLVIGGRAPGQHFPWVPSLGLEIALRLDGLGLLFTLLISGIGAVVVIYGGDYLADHPYQARFFIIVLMFMASMLGLVLSDNLFLTFIFWELTSITSFLLIGFDHQRYDARAAAWQALLVTAFGGLAMLAGLVILAQISGSPLFSQINQRGDLIRGHSLYPIALALILIGAFTKSAQFPFHFWLPNAMAAPTPVSAYLHSATMVKAGIFLLARLTPALSGTPIWQTTVSIIGFLTFLTGAFLSLGQHDLKRLLAYTTIASLGAMTFLIGLGTDLAIKAAVLYLLAHALYKGALFLVAGAIDHSAGTRDIKRLGGLLRTLPWSGLAALLAGISMAGLPPLLGFISKELLYEALLSSSPALLWVGGALLANAVMVIVAGLVAIKPFFGTPGNTPHSPHVVSPGFWSGSMLLSSLGLLGGLFPRAFTVPLVQAATTTILQKPLKIELHLWHGLTPMLLLSTLTLGLGLIGWFAYQRLWRWGTLWEHLGRRWGPSQIYEYTLNGLRRFAAWQARILQNGYLRFYIVSIVLTTVILTGITPLSRVAWIFTPNWGNVYVHEATVVGLMVVAAIIIPWLRSRLATIAVMGMIGYGLVLIYLLYGAPDLAMVQFAIETLIVILFVLAVYRLPKFTRLTSLPTRALDLLVALSGGLLMATIVLIVTARPLVPHISEYFAQNSLRLANGRNVVNVILVDFRGFDTLGEITVLALAGIGVYALVRLSLGRLALHFKELGTEEEEVEHESVV